MTHKGFQMLYNRIQNFSSVTILVGALGSRIEAQFCGKKEAFFLQGIGHFGVFLVVVGFRFKMGAVGVVLLHLVSPGVSERSSTCSCNGTSCGSVAAMLWCIDKFYAV